MTDIIRVELNNLSNIANLSLDLVNGEKFGNTEKYNVPLCQDHLIKHSYFINL